MATHEDVSSIRLTPVSSTPRVVAFGPNTSAAAHSNPHPDQKSIQAQSADDGKEATEPTPSQSKSKRRRQFTNLEEVPIEDRPQIHKYIIRRPRALQVQYKGKHIEIGDHGLVNVDEIKANALSAQTTHASGNTSAATSSSVEGNAEERSTDSIEVQRGRLDLFVDLLWVGIISNISEHFFSQAFSDDVSSGLAFVEFLVLFLPAYSMWAALQVFLSQYFMDDFLQRTIIVWYLILGLTWGNNAPYIFDSYEDATTIIDVYLVALATLRVTELVYSIWMPWLRRAFLVRMIFTIPLIGIWIGATCTRDWTQIGLVIAAVSYERVTWVLEMSPLGDMISGDSVRTTRDWKHTIRRFENFFTIVIGEGVFLLIRSSPAGRGYSLQLGRAVMVLMIYYLLHWLYYNGDQAKRIVHPIYRRWYIKTTWFFLHVPLFMSLVLMSSGMLYLIDYTPEGVNNGVPADLERRQEAEPSASQETFDVAKTTCYVTVSVQLFCQLIIALLAKPLDPPKTLLINNRYIRLTPRALAVPLFAGLWAYDFQSSTSIISSIIVTLWVIFIWEWQGGLERGGGILEPMPKAEPRDEEAKQ